jgi:hypothetical protein
LSESSQMYSIFKSINLASTFSKAMVNHAWHGKSTPEYFYKKLTHKVLLRNQIKSLFLAFLNSTLWVNFTFFRNKSISRRRTTPKVRCRELDIFKFLGIFGNYLRILWECLGNCQSLFTFLIVNWFLISLWFSWLFTFSKSADCLHC